MYINDLGMERISSTGTGWANRVYGRRTDSYAAEMKKAVERRKTSVTPTFASAGDVIIREAFEKMKTDPEWEETVMDKVKEYYSNSAGYGYTGWAGTNSLPGYGYTLQSLLGSQNGYSAYGLGNLAAAAYSNVMNSAFGGSLFGSWQL